MSDPRGMDDVELFGQLMAHVIATKRALELPDDDPGVALAMEAGRRFIVRGMLVWNAAMRAL